MLFEKNTFEKYGADDYYPSGMAMPGRSFSAGTQYRYGFNGKENDKDISDGAQDYGLRINDNRLGKFLSVDPLTRSYPMLTPYQYASNDPIESLDVDGLERMDYRLMLNSDGSTKLTFLSAGPKKDKVTMANHGSWADLLPAGTEAVPFHYRIEYNGQHYVFNGGGPNGNVANLPVASKYAQDASAVHYIGQMADFVKTPEAYMVPFISEEESGVRQFQNGVAMDLNAQALEAITTTGIAVGVAAIGSRQATAINGGNPGAAKANTATLGEISNEQGLRVLNTVKSGVLPGSRGAYLGGSRLTNEQMQTLTDQHKVEFAQVYTGGSGKNGGGGFYTLYSGTSNTVDIPIAPNSFLINHTHPGGTPVPSIYDIRYLLKSSEVGSPQKSSIILPSGGSPR